MHRKKEGKIERKRERKIERNMKERWKDVQIER